MTKEEQLARLQIENLALRVLLTLLNLGIDSGQNQTEYISTQQRLMHLGESLAKGIEESATIFPNGGEIFLEAYRRISQEFLTSLAVPLDVE